VFPDENDFEEHLKALELHKNRKIYEFDEEDINDFRQDLRCFILGYFTFEDVNKVQKRIMLELFNHE